jgi:formylglycine-generating enzyme required for sulfatase activity
MTEVRIFISSPGDTNTERAIARNVVARLARKYRNHFSLEAILWEDEPLVATEHFQQQIVKPEDSDIVVVIVWWRLGTLLPPDRYRGDLTDKSVTGTEWEFENAFAAYMEHGKPDLLFYRKLGAPQVAWGVNAEQTLEQARQVSEQQHELEAFTRKWLADEQVKKAHWQFETTSAFEDMLASHLDGLLRKRLSQEDDAPRRWIEGSPYRGLKSFELEHAAIFFGRTRARNELRDALTQQVSDGFGFLMVLGASGSGKSSLVKAGLLADLAVPGMIHNIAETRHLVIQPALLTDGLISGLAAALLSETALPELATQNYDAPALTSLVEQSLSADASQILVPPFATALEEARKKAYPPLADHADIRLVVVVDQFEELFTQTRISAAERERFVESLARLIGTGLVWVVATMRSDFLESIETLPRLAELCRGNGLFLLQPPDTAELGQVIREPATEAGVRFETHPETGIPLDETIRLAAVGSAAPLPLVEFLLDELWCSAEDKSILTYEAYENLGGLEGAIGQRAEQMFSQLDPAVQKELPSILRDLVTLGTDASSRFTARPANTPDRDSARQLVEKLIDSRLLVSATNEAGGATIRVAHESLFDKWNRARETLERETLALKLRTYLEGRYNQWRESAESERNQRLLSGPDLNDANQLKARFNDELSSGLIEYIRQSNLRATRASRYRKAALSAVTLLAVFAAISFWYASLDDWNQYVFLRKLRMALSGPSIPETVTIPSGTNQMGDDRGVDLYRERDVLDLKTDERPQHATIISRPFELGKYETSFSEFGDYLVSTGGIEWHARPDELKNGVISTPDLPVVQIRWDETQAYAEWLSEVTGETYRLPSEAEWEYSARGGITARNAFWWGNEHDVGKANCRDCGSPWDDISAAPVNSFEPNPWGLHNMIGNVWEFTADCYHENYLGAPNDGSAWYIADYHEREGECPGGFVIRGGSWVDGAHDATLATRETASGHIPNEYYGFRILKESTNGSVQED